MDCSYMVMVPHVVPDIPPLKKMPYIFYFQDRFSFPGPFVPDTVVSIDNVIDKKTAMLNCHVSQFYEWLPWVGGYSKKVPPEHDREGRLDWLKSSVFKRVPKISDTTRGIIERRYGSESDAKISFFEAFQLCEYGAQTEIKKLDRLFPL